MIWKTLQEETPKHGEYVLVLTTDADDDPLPVTAHWNGKTIGFLGVGGKKVKPASHWMRIPTPPEKWK